MGLGTLFLYADADTDPRELLNEFALVEGFPWRCCTQGGFRAGYTCSYAGRTVPLPHIAAVAALPCVPAAATTHRSKSAMTRWWPAGAAAAGRNPSSLRDDAMKFWPGKTIKSDKPELPIEHRIRAAHFRFGFGMGITAALGMTALLTSLELGEPVTPGLVAAPAISGVIVGGLLMWSARRETAGWLRKPLRTGGKRSGSFSGNSTRRRRRTRNAGTDQAEPSGPEPRRWRWRPSSGP